MTRVTPGAAPADLVPGDPDAVERVALRLTRVATSASDVADKLETLEGDVWTGAAAELYRGAIGDVPTRLSGAAEAFAAAAQALRDYAGAPREAQATATQAVRMERSTPEHWLPPISSRPTPCWRARPKRSTPPPGSRPSGWAEPRPTPRRCLRPAPAASPRSRSTPSTGSTIPTATSRRRATGAARRRHALHLAPRRRLRRCGGHPPAAPATPAGRPGPRPVPDARSGWSRPARWPRRGPRWPV